MSRRIDVSRYTDISYDTVGQIGKTRPTVSTAPSGGPIWPGRISEKERDAAKRSRDPLAAVIAHKPARRTAANLTHAPPCRRDSGHVFRALVRSDPTRSLNAAVAAASTALRPLGYSL